MELLFTGFALLCAAACGFLVWQCNNYAAEARHALHELKKSQGVIHAHTLSIETLAQQVRRLHGRMSQKADKPSRAGDFTREDWEQHGVDLEPEVDPALAAELALQNAPAVAPGKTR